MAHIDIEEQDWESTTTLAVQDASPEDVIECPHIRSYNLAIRLLVDLRPGTMIYVRLRGWKYWPRLDDNPELSQIYGLGPIGIFSQGDDNV